MVRGASIVQHESAIGLLESKYIVVVGGNLATGKTTIAHLINRRLGWNIGREAVDDNLYLADFYRDMGTWAFHLQISFLGSRARQHIVAAETARSTILDRSIYDDVNVFARALRDTSKLSQRDYDTYTDLANLFLMSLPAPQLFLYVRASPEALLDRIRKRGLQLDQGVTKAYLSLIDLYYEEWLQTFSMCPILKINVDNTDFENNEVEADILLKALTSYLRDGCYESGSLDIVEYKWDSSR